MQHEGIVDNHGVAIRYLRLDGSLPSDGTVPAEGTASLHGDRPPLIVIPGMCECADDYVGRFRDRLTRNIIAIDLRGRGNSDAPPRGYSFEDQLSDICTVIDALDGERFVLAGFSVGAAFAIRYTLDRPHDIAGLVIVDYPPHYPEFTDAWMRSILDDSANRMPRHVVQGLMRESSRVVFSHRLAEIQCPALVIRGTTDDSLLPPSLAALYGERMARCTVAPIVGMGHDPFAAHRDTFLDSLESFLASTIGT
jgi:pimeloyl-ACP methyl ester carboxylesterase